MARSRRLRRRTGPSRSTDHATEPAGRLLGLVLLAALLGACASGGGPAGVAELARWADGPVRWLLLPEERRQLERLGSSTQALAFIEEFWARRDPDGVEPGNPARETFASRVDAADLLYGEPGVRGSLTDRGGALILMGPASHVRVAREPALSWSPQLGTPDAVGTREVEVEVWGYRVDDLSPALLELLLERGEGSEEALVLTLTFVGHSDRRVLREGRDLLELAARALARSR